MRTDGKIDPSTAAVLRAYVDAVTLFEPLQRRIWAASQLTLGQLRALHRLTDAPKSLGQLGDELGLTPPSVTRVADRLEERGLIARHRDELDRRRVYVAATAEGRRLLASVPLLRESVIRRAVERLGPRDRARIAGALAELARAVRQAETEDASAPAMVS